MESVNYVARLNELAQATGLKLRYEDLGSVGADHEKIFIQRVVYDDKTYPEGKGKSKKEARQNAAKNALNGLVENEHQDPDDLTNAAAGDSTTASHHTSSGINYICKLNEYCQKNTLTPEPRLSTKAGPNGIVYCCSFLIDGKEYPARYGNTKTNAKAEAAKCAYDILHCNKTEAGVENHNNPSGQQQEALTQDVSAICSDMEDLSVSSKNNLFAETNFIGAIINYCQTRSYSREFVQVKQCGPPHNPQFFYKLVINKKEYPVGEGKSIKQAKQKAAQLACHALQAESGWNSEGSFSGATSDNDAPSSIQESCESSAPQRIPTTASESIIFKDSSNPSRCQGSALSKSDAPISMSIATSRESQSSVTDSSHSTDFYSSSQAEDQAAVKSNSISNTPTTPQYSFRLNFDFIESLGEGGFGSVFKAREILVDRYYAVKIVRGNKKALREVVVLSDLQHPNIVRYYNCWMENSKYTDHSAAPRSQDQYLYIKMELCQTRTLETWIKKRNMMPLPDIKREEDSLIILQQIVNGVEYIHSEKHFHRDLKPVNIMFGVDEKVKIGDFGLVTTEADDDDENPMERTNTGTRSYMAPEQKKEKNYGRKVDIFALGLISLELFCRFGTRQERAVTFTKARSQELPKELASSFPHQNLMIKSMLSPKPEDRPEAHDVKKYLEKWFNTSLPDEFVTV